MNIVKRVQSLLLLVSWEWETWLERNRRVFRPSLLPVSGVIFAMKQVVDFWVLAGVRHQQSI
jgi:hypothetical protein